MLTQPAQKALLAVDKLETKPNRAKDSFFMSVRQISGHETFDPVTRKVCSP